METTVAPEALEATAEHRKVRGEGLTGEALQALLHANQDAEEETLMRLAGYFTDTLDENDEVIKTTYRKKEFYAAFAACFGVKIKKPARAAGSPKGARKAVKVAINTKKITIVGYYSELAGFEENDKVAIHAEPGKITVTLLEKAPEATTEPKSRVQAELPFDDSAEDEDDDEFMLEDDEE
jgi:hypothetical protein